MGGGEELETKKKLENVENRHAAICEMRKYELFKEAHELAVSCNAEVGVITIADDGTIHEFASSSMQSIIERYRKRQKIIEGRYASMSKSVNQEADKPMPEEVVAEKPKSKQNVAGKDFACNKLEDLKLEQLIKELMGVRESKNQFLMEEFERSRKLTHHLLQQNQILKRQIEELQGDRASGNSQERSSPLPSANSAAPDIKDFDKNL